MRSLRVRYEGSPTGHLLRLVQVLREDSAGWRHHAGYCRERLVTFEPVEAVHVSGKRAADRELDRLMSDKKGASRRGLTGHDAIRLHADLTPWVPAVEIRAAGLQAGITIISVSRGVQAPEISNECSL